MEGHGSGEYTFCGLGSYRVVYCGEFRAKGRSLAFQNEEDIQEPMSGRKSDILGSKVLAAQQDLVMQAAASHGNTSLIFSKIYIIKSFNPSKETDCNQQHRTLQTT